MNPILIVEDDPDISDLLCINLKYSGFKTKLSQNCYEARELIKKYQFDLALLDIMLPDINGLSLIPIFNKQNIPVIIVSAKDRTSDKINALNLGADDYITKPFDHIELLARIKALLRRINKQPEVLTFGNISIDLKKQRVTKNGIVISLTLKEYQLLECLAENRGMIFSRNRLLEKIWNYEVDCDTRTVDMHITRIRNKLISPIIETVYKRGYKIE